MRLTLSILLLLLFVPGWSGIPRLPLIAPDVTVRASGFVPAGGWPARIGALEPVGAVRLQAADRAFGGFSALALWRGQAILLSDGGNFVRIAIRGGHLSTLAAGSLTDGPGRGWEKENRDSESLAIDPASGRMWVGYERANAIWRYAPDLARGEGWRAPAAMRRWGDNSGAESLVRFRDGRFLAISEGSRKGSKSRPAVLFAGDPTGRSRIARLSYRPPPGFSPSDAAELPDGDLLVLNRRFRLPFRFTANLVRIARGEIRPGATMRGSVIATLGPDLIGENAEGLAITREGEATMIWIVTDNDNSLWRPTILAKFRLR